MNIEIITGFLGWCAVINIGLLLFSTVMVIAARKQISSLHGRMFNLDEKEISKMYFNYLGNYKITVIVLNIVPYFALKIMG